MLKSIIAVNAEHTNCTWSTDSDMQDHAMMWAIDQFHKRMCDLNY